MLSICVPIYNFDVRNTVRRLKLQAEMIEEEVEIVCIDDHSNQHYRDINASISSDAHYIKLPHNVGRSAIRNMFLQHATQPYLLFLDCDSVIVSRDFLKTYVRLIKAEAPQVVSGGCVYPPRYGRNQRLRYMYGNRHETKPSAVRSSDPYGNFTARNFVVRREILQAIPFDERVLKYGYEDSLFAYQLKCQGITVKHIDNMVEHGYLESNQEYLSKTIESMSGLSQIYNFMWEDQSFCRHVRLLNAYNKIHRSHIESLVLFVFRVSHHWMERNFVRGWANPNAFEFYRLGRLIKCIKALS